MKQAESSASRRRYVPPKRLLTLAAVSHYISKEELFTIRLRYRYQQVNNVHRYKRIRVLSLH
jgi:hypothetical protein